MALPCNVSWHCHASVVWGPLDRLGFLGFRVSGFLLIVCVAVS
jgi:hypothetical protein